MNDPNVKPDENGLINPFVINDGEKKTNPDQKTYLLLLVKIYPGEDDVKDWVKILGRSIARQYVIDHIDEIDVYNSLVLVEGTEFLPDKIPSIYTLFTDPRSSWCNPEIYPDQFNIDEHIAHDDLEASEFVRDEPMPATNGLAGIEQQIMFGNSVANKVDLN